MSKKWYYLKIKIKYTQLQISDYEIKQIDFVG